MATARSALDGRPVVGQRAESTVPLRQVTGTGVSLYLSTHRLRLAKQLCVTGDGDGSLGVVEDIVGPGPDCWLTEAVEAAPSSIEGSGLFAVEPIRADVVVARFGGRLVDDAELNALILAASSYVDTLSVYPDTNLVLPAGTANHSGNHSCDPTTWWVDPFSTATRRDIEVGDELTIDYGTITDDPDFIMVCNCGSQVCRKVVTETDWTRPELQARYQDHWVPVLRDRIAR